MAQRGKKARKKKRKRKTVRGTEKAEDRATAGVAASHGLGSSSTGQQCFRQQAPLLKAGAASWGFSAHGLRVVFMFLTF